MNWIENKEKELYEIFQQEFIECLLQGGHIIYEDTINNHRKVTQALFEYLGIYHISCYYGKSVLLKHDLIETHSYHYNKDKTIWVKNNIYSTNFGHSEKVLALDRLKMWIDTEAILDKEYKEYYIKRFDKIERGLWGLPLPEEIVQIRKKAYLEGSTFKGLWKSLLNFFKH